MHSLAPPASYVAIVNMDLQPIRLTVFPLLYSHSRCVMTDKDKVFRLGRYPILRVDNNLLIGSTRYRDIPTMSTAGNDVG